MEHAVYSSTYFDAAHGAETSTGRPFCDSNGPVPFAPLFESLDGLQGANRWDQVIALAAPAAMHESVLGVGKQDVFVVCRSPFLSR